MQLILKKNRKLIALEIKLATLIFKKILKGQKRVETFYTLESYKRYPYHWPLGTPKRIICSSLKYRKWTKLTIFGDGGMKNWVKCQIRERLKTNFFKVHLKFKAWRCGDTQVTLKLALDCLKSLIEQKNNFYKWAKKRI